MSKTKTATTNRVDAVFIRKSTQGQDEAGQIANVQAMLRDRGVQVTPDHWFVGTVSRRKIKSNPDFARLIELVEADRVRTVYVESQDRWGTADRVELFGLLGTLRTHDTALFDLRAGKDLTARDMTTELLAVLGSIKSEKELQDIAYRSLRTRVNNFQASGSWPTGTHPYGYGKACYAADGRLLWVWQPRDRKRGRVLTPGPDGGMVAGPERDGIPRKARGEIIKLVPSDNMDSVRAVRLVFDLYTRVGLSRRAISARLNAEGLTFNGGVFTHPDVTHILQNPAYAGDTVFGKIQTGELHTFDASGLVIEAKAGERVRRRPVNECIVRKDTHEALIDRKTWDLAQQKLRAERERVSFSPRNPAYFLKQVLVCGHCGKGMTARTETNSTNGKRTVVYVCSTYTAGRCNGHDSPCGYQRITHDEAERLLMDKLAELGRPLHDAGSEPARDNLRQRLARLGADDEESHKQWRTRITEAINAFVGYLMDNYGVDYPVLPRMRKLALDYFCGDDIADLELTFEKGLVKLRSAIKEAERLAVERATGKLATLTQEHKKLTLAWAKASELQQPVLREEIDRLEAEIGVWQPRTEPMSKRLEELYRTERDREAERQKLLGEWPALEAREKGESLRRHFEAVKLYWEKQYHPPLKKAYRPRKTKRQGRHSYRLQTGRTEWTLTALHSGSSW